MQHATRVHHHGDGEPWIPGDTVAYPGLLGIPSLQAAGEAPQRLHEHEGGASRVASLATTTTDRCDLLTPLSQSHVHRFLSLHIGAGFCSVACRLLILWRAWPPDSTECRRAHPRLQSPPTQKPTHLQRDRACQDLEARRSERTSAEGRSPLRCLQLPGPSPR